MIRYPELGDHVWIDPSVRDFYRWDEDLGESVPAFAPGEPVPVSGEVIGTGYSSLDGAHVTVEWHIIRSVGDMTFRSAAEIVVDPSMVMHVPSTTLPCHDSALAQERTR